MKSASIDQTPECTLANGSRFSPRRYLRYFRPGDWLVIGIAILVLVASTQIRGPAGAATTLIVRSNGVIVERIDLAEDRRFSVAGPLGATVVAIHERRARIIADPGRQQICVRQGWLEHAGDTALCLPNRITIELVGAAPRYDSLNY